MNVLSLTPNQCRVCKCNLNAHPNIQIFVKVSTLPTWNTRERCSIGVFLASVEHDLEVVFLKSLQPAGKLAFWVLEIGKPGETSMIGSQDK